MINVYKAPILVAYRHIVDSVKVVFVIIISHSQWDTSVNFTCIRYSLGWKSLGNHRNHEKGPNPLYRAMRGRSCGDSSFISLQVFRWRERERERERERDL
jgi:hypothetical protein